jgi:replication fork protection complex subunit Csm3/Swi3
MDTSINDIWDLPVETSIRHTPRKDIWPSTPPCASSNPPLFLPSDDDEDLDEDTAPNAQPNRDANPNPDVDALFEGLDDIDDSFQELAPALDLDALRREADARNAHAVRAEIGATVPSAAEPTAAAKTSGGKGGGALGGIDGEGDDDGKKKRKPVPKLDEARLLGKDGLLQLVKDTKNFKPKGKGHEVVIILSLPFPSLPARLICGLTRRPSDSGLGSRAPSVPILDPQTISQN